MQIIHLSDTFIIRKILLFYVRYLQSILLYDHNHIKTPTKLK